MAATSALHTAGAVTSAPAARLAQAALVAKSGITPRTGVVYAGNRALLTATANTAPMQVKVSPLHYVGSKADTQGTYQGANDGDYLLTIAAAPGSGSRTDVVYIMQQDANAGTTSPDATTAPLIAATSGTLPAGAVRVGSVVVPAGVTKLTDAGVVVTTDCQWTAAAGAPIPVSSKAQRDALPTYVGRQVIRLDAAARVETWDGTGWLTEVYAMDVIVATNGNGEFSLPSGLSTIKYANFYNGNGGIVRGGARVNITIARNSAGASYSGGTLTGIVYAADTKAPVSSTNVYVDWFAKGYS